MLQLTTGLIENTHALAIDMRPTCVVPIKSASGLSRPNVILGVRISNGDTTAVSIEIKGFYMNGTTKVEYISDLVSINSGDEVLRQYYVQFDAFEFRFFSSSQDVEVSAWGINSAGKSTTPYSVLPAELNCFVGPTGTTGATGAVGPGFQPIDSNSSHTVYVRKSGSDITGDGTINNPFATIPRAMTSIVDATPTKRYSIMVGPGNYSESFCLKSNVMLIGLDPILVCIGSSGSSNNINDGHSSAYTPANPGNWSPVPANVQEALDQLATRTPISVSEAVGYIGTTGYTGAIGPTVLIFNRNGERLNF